jgi:hypothetical protein
MPLHDVSTLRGFLKELGFTILGAGIAIGILFLLGFLKNSDILGLSSILDSQGSLLIAALLMLEFMFLSALIAGYYYFD